jgi:hypothetical protein
MELQLAITQNDERAGLPSASDWSRLMKCRASFLLSKKAYELPFPLIALLTRLQP